mmetsp:Transcript_5345/g.12934  ORF Transcript_5345/g.12934 Transcript_5345/m.12934 type:complete len:111 (-) Transcript_5345:1258-1590(-)
MPPPPSDPKSSLPGIPEHRAYGAGVVAMVVWAYRHRERTHASPLVVAFGPVAWAEVLALWTAPLSLSRRKACLAPFDRDSASSLGLHLGMGVLLGIVPVFHLLVLVLGDR